MEDKNDMYWKSRQTVRSRIHLVHMMHGMFMAFYFGNSIRNLTLDLFSFILGLPCCNLYYLLHPSSAGPIAHLLLPATSAFFFFSEPRLGRRYLSARQLFYDVTICAITMHAAVNITLLAWKEAPSDLSLMPLQARGLVDKMVRGQIPFPALGTFITPVLLSSAGMSLRICKLATLFHLCIFISTIVAVFIKTKSESCVLDGSVENTCTANFVHDLSAFSVVLALAIVSSIPSAQISNDFVTLLRDGRHADSVLNHVLKNSIAGAASLVELGLEDCPESEPRDLFESALEQLYLAMTWCASRQVMLDLASGKYLTAHSPVNDVTKFLKGVASGVAQVTIRDSTKQITSELNVDVSFDEKLARLALENAKTNAISHGDGGHIELGAEFQNRGGTAAAVVILYVKNSLPPGFEVTNELLDDVVQRASGSGEYRDTSDTQHKGPVKLSRDSKSTRAGLPHIHLACQGAGGSFNLTLDDAGDVICTIILPAQLTPRSDKGEVMSVATSAESFDSIEQLTLHSEVVSPSSAARTRSASSSDIPSPSSAARIRSASSSDVPLRCKILVIDDSVILCKGYSRIVLPALNADPTRSEVVRPTNKDHVDSFFENALGKMLNSEELDPADIVVLDQNIDLEADNRTVYGTDLADQLRSHGFTGLILIRSANAGDADCAEYRLSGAVDGCISKDGSNKDLVASIRKEYASKKHEA